MRRLLLILVLALTGLLAFAYLEPSRFTQLTGQVAELAGIRKPGELRTVYLRRVRDGDFGVNARVNGFALPMVLDSGASAVMLTYEHARSAGLPVEILKYTVEVETANGTTRAAPVTIDRIAVSGLIERAVPALVAQPRQLKSSLLGLSFLNRLESWEVRADGLILNGYP